MDLISELITGVLFSVIVLFMMVTSCMKMTKLNTPTVFNILFYFGLIAIGVLEFLCVRDVISYFKFGTLVAMILPMLNAIILSVFAMLTIDEINAKKTKTLWRLPVIGLLLGYTGVEYNFYMNLGIMAVILIIYIKNQEKLRILSGKIFGLLIWVVSLYFIRENGFWYLNCVLIFFCLITFSLWDMMRIKVLAWDKNE